MKVRSLILILLAVCFIVLPCGVAEAQDSIELPDIKGSHSQEYKEIKIEITSVKRMRTYQAYWYRTERPRGRKITADPGFEVAVICIHTTRLGANAGININRLSLYDADAKKYEADLASIYFLGTRSDSPGDPKEHDYEFPVIVGKGIQFSAVRLQQFTRNDTKPFFVFQNIIFDVSKFNW